MANKLDAKAFGLAGGILWAAVCFLLGLSAMSGWGAEWVTLLANIYKGYNATFGGAIIGALWGFVDAFIGLWIFAWLYNKLAK